MNTVQQGQVGKIQPINFNLNYTKRPALSKILRLRIMIWDQLAQTVSSWDSCSQNLFLLNCWNWVYECSYKTPGEKYQVIHNNV